MAESKCPLPTQDIKTNLANRQKAIDVAHYGPANPKEPNEEYWTSKAKIFGGSVKEAKTMRCGNCAGFNQTSKLIDCISKGIGSDAQEVEQAGDLGYCEIFDFKCASMRTCDAWIVGGPITDKTNLEQLKADLLSLKEQGVTLLYDPSQARDESGRWTDGGFVSGAETPREISNRIISRIQKENPEINIEDGKFKKAVESLGENLKGAKIIPQYGQTKTKEISNWIKSDKGQKFIGAVDKTLKVTGAGAIGALKGLDEAKFDIATNAIFAPQIIPFIATRSAMQGIFNNAVKEYRSIKKGEEIKTAVQKQVRVKPLESIITITQFQEEININDVVEYLTDVLRVSILKYIKNTKKFEIATFAYDPSQERDQSGKWTSGGGKGGEILVSPNIKENMNYEEAKKMTDSPEHARAVSIAKDVIKKQGMDGKIESGVGDWEDGAENSIKIDVKNIKDFNQLEYTASKLGAMLNQKAVVAFQKKKDGPDILHKITADKPMDDVRKILSDNGISFRTMVGDRAKTSVTILDKGSQLTANVAKFLGAINGKSEAVRGVGEFIGGDTRIAGKKAYKGIIDNYERSFPNRVHLGLQRRGGRNYYRSYQAIDFYDPSQQRDESGKWTGGGAIAQGATPTPRWAQDNPAEASKKTGEATTLYHGTSADVLKTIRKEGLKPSKSGVWGGGKVYSTDSLDLAFEYGVLRSGTAPKIGGKQLIGIISVLAEGFKSVADNIPTTKAQKMGKTGLAAVSKIFTKNGGVAPSAIKKMQIFDVDSIRKYVYENGPKPSPLATKELAEGSQLIYVPIVIQLPDDGSEGFQFDDAVAVESFVFQYNGEKIEFYDPNQPRDEKGRWAGGGGGIKSSKASGKAKQVSETSESQDNEDVDSMVKRLENEPKARKAISDMNKLRQQTADREGISFDDASVTRWSLRDPSRYKQSKDIVETLRNPTPHHREWINQQVKEGLNPNAKSENPVAVILMGSPASGKTTTGRPFANKILGGQQVTTIDPDSIKAKSHGFQGWNAGAFHDESAIIAEKMIMPRATQERHNMLIDITGQNSTKVSEMAKNLKALGYTVGVVHIDVDDKTALGRASQRFNKPNGRWVPPSYIKGAAEKARNTWNKLTKDNLIDIGYQVDGNVSRSKGEAPVKETYGKIFE